jgi:hypothetical protein
MGQFVELYNVDPPCRDFGWQSRFWR